MSKLLCSVLFCVSLALLCGCATSQEQVATHVRSFDFQKDTFAYANELTWSYHTNADGKWIGTPREPKPDYTLHCFVVAHAARQFFRNAHFDPTLSTTNNATYRELVSDVMHTHSARALPESKRVTIPGYADLRDFSAAHGQLLKSECGGAWRSYFQRGNWRMIFPFSRSSQKKVAQRLASDLKEDRLPIVHLVRFPQLTINHAMLVFAEEQTRSNVVFSAYDPNQPNHPTDLIYDRKEKTFKLPANKYFPGGRVDVYEVYRNLIY